MNTNFKQVMCLAILGIVATACGMQGQSSQDQVATYTPTGEVKTVILNLTPIAPLLPKQGVSDGHLQIIMDDYDFSSSYTTEFQRTEVSPPTGKFLWVHVAVKNTGTREEKIPHFSLFTVLYQEIQIEATYGHRQNFPDYTNQNFLEDRIPPGQSREGWLRYLIPANANFSDILFRYGLFSPHLIEATPYMKQGQPVYLWVLTP